jgi:RecQ family ATP-dependent DNA helicase
VTPAVADPLTTLRQRFGFEGFRPYQEEIVAAVLSGQSVLAVLPTSAGKSLCYQLPAVMLPGLTIVVSPLIALMKDQVDALNRRGIAAVALNSHLTAGQARDALAAVRRGSVKLVYVAPERLLNGDFLSALSRAKVSLIAVDEAHCLSQWGHDFRPDYRLVPLFRQRVGAPPVLALTATAPGAVRTEIERELGIGRQVVAPMDRPNLRYGVASVATEREQAITLSGWLSALGDGSVVVYVSTRKATETWAQRLGGAAQGVVAYNAGMDGAARQRVQEAFMSGAARVIVATTAFGMGVDKPDIRGVIHLGLAESVESYVQEVGRAGRDGGAAWAVTISLLGRDALLRRRLLERQRPDRVWLEGRLAAVAATPPGGTLELGEPAEPYPQPQVVLLLPHLLERGVVAAPEERSDIHTLRVRKTLSGQDARSIMASIERRYASKMRRFSALVAYMQGTACRRDSLADYFSAPRAEAREAVCCDRCDPEAFAVARAQGARTTYVVRARAPVAAAAESPPDAGLGQPRADEIVVAALDCEVEGAVGSAGARKMRLVIWKGDGTVALHDPRGLEPLHAVTDAASGRWDADRRVLSWGAGSDRLALRVHGVGWQQRLVAGDRAGAGRSADAIALSAPATAPGDQRLREALREWRKRKAQERGVPAYVICWDRHLDAIARERPAGREALARIPGLPGPTRDAYGDEILALVADFARGEG